MERLDIGFAGVPLQLLADRALYWPERRLLVIADPHLGKGDIFRSHGIAVPSGGTGHDLARLDRLLALTGAEGLLILGDVLHGARGRMRWLQDWRRFLGRWPRLAVSAVAGNHDRALSSTPLGLQQLGEVWQVEGLHFCHDVATAPAPAVGGHLHPVLRLPGEPRRAPVFWLQPQRLVLPSFSAFTGGWQVDPEQGDRLVACNGEQLLALDAVR